MKDQYAEVFDIHILSRAYFLFTFPQRRDFINYSSAQQDGFLPLDSAKHVIIDFFRFDFTNSTLFIREHNFVGNGEVTCFATHRLAVCPIIAFCTQPNVQHSTSSLAHEKLRPSHSCAFVYFFRITRYCKCSKKSL